MRSKRMAIMVLAAVLAAGSVVVACGDDDDEVETGGPDTTVSEDGLSEEPPQAELDERYVGLDKQEAIDLAEEAGVIWRIEREDDEEFALTMDYRPERVNFSIDDGVVTSVRAG